MQYHRPRIFNPSVPTLCKLAASPPASLPIVAATLRLCVTSSEDTRVANVPGSSPVSGPWRSLLFVSAVFVRCDTHFYGYFLSFLGDSSFGFRLRSAPIGPQSTMCFHINRHCSCPQRPTQSLGFGELVIVKTMEPGPESRSWSRPGSCLWVLSPGTPSTPGVVGRGAEHFVNSPL